MLYMQKDLVLMIIKSIIKSEITVTTQENIEELLMIFAIQDKKHQTKFLQYFVMILHMIVIL